MADDKTKKKVLVKGKAPESLSPDDIVDALEAGDLQLDVDADVKVEPDPEELFTLERFEKFLLGEMTWAELNGMTMDEAYNIAEYGYSLYQEGRYHDARDLFEALVFSNPYDAYFHSMLGAVYQQLDMKEEAAEEYTTAVELDGEQIHAYVNRGELLLQNGEFDRALSDLRRAIELDPDGKEEAGMRARALALATANALEEVDRLIQAETKKG